MAKNIYLQVEFGTGNLFEYSKEEKEGFEEHRSSKGTVSWRKYWKEGVYGIYRGTSIFDSNFGKEVSIHLVDANGDNVYVKLPLLTQDKAIAPYAESYIGVLPAMEKDFVYRVFPYAMEREGTKYKNYGVSVAHADMHERTVRSDYPLERLKYAHTKKDGTKVEGDIPEAIWEDAVGGSKTKNSKKRDLYLYSVLEANATGSQKMSNKVKGEEPPKKYSTNGAPSQAPKKEEPKKEPVVAYEQESNKKESVAQDKNEAPAPAPKKVTESESTPEGDDVELPF
jgi:hypothetical protein